MKLVTPPFINHEGKPIFSCDIHPDGLRFATGGQGSSSGRIAIWNLRPVLDEALDSDENIPKCLCLLENHASCVNSVRWSHSGKNLASGGDDKLIMIWVRSGDGRVNSDGVPIGLDQWRCAHTLSSHESDVLDVAWGPGDKQLASCSVDNTVIVWNMDGKPAVLTKLFGHTGLVKGVAWDPVGEYLASQSDDKSVRIWRTSDWKQQVAVTEPFKECGDITHVLRLDWSPDGLYVVSAHASNSGGPTAQIIDRAMDAEKKCWPSEMDFVGHRKAVTCVKFNKNLMRKSPGESKFCLVATGSRDCSIAVWSTLQQRPILALKNCFTRAVVDMSWGLDGRVLMACSWDGSVMFFYFKHDELGQAVSSEDKLAALEALYGKRLVHGKVEPIVEMPELLDVVPKKETPVAVQPEAVPTAEVAVAPVEPVVVLKAKQFEMKLADGKRRITPITLADGPAANLGSLSSASSNVKTNVEFVQRTEVHTAPCPPQTEASQAQLSKAPIVENSTVVDAPSPPKKKRGNLMQPEMTKTTPLTTPGPRFDCRPANRSLLRPLGVDSSVKIPVSGSVADFIVVQNSKEPRMAKIRRESTNVEAKCVWENVLAHPVVAAKSNFTMSVFVCVDRSVHVLNSGCGTPMRLPLLLPGPAACIDLTSKQQLCIVTTCGYVIVWELRKNAQILRDSTLKGELLSDPTAFSLCTLRENGLPLVVLNNGRSFSYSNEVGWQMLTDVKTPLWQLANQKDFSGPIGSDSPFRGLVRDVRACAGVSSSVRGQTVQSTTTALCSTSIMHQHMLASDAMGSEIEFKSALLALVRQYAQDGAVPQLRDIISTHAVPRGLLNDCLGTIKGYLQCQRLYAELSGPLLNDEESLGPPWNFNF